MVKPYTRVLRESIIAELRASYPMPLSTKVITSLMPFQPPVIRDIGDYGHWRWWAGRDDIKVLAETGDTITVQYKPMSAEVYNSLRALERKGVIARTPKDPDSYDRFWTYLPDDKVDNEIADLDKLWEMS